MFVVCFCSIYVYEEKKVKNKKENKEKGAKKNLFFLLLACRGSFFIVIILQWDYKARKGQEAKKTETVKSKPAKNEKEK